eukprot:TRINITY_DN19864_c0_g1_i1.p1 TRINITY_DN19864_c0_g1~~TRINITY_DN19864_c0_g1_i1.p1  ORF type:complete len:730 (+),score=256.49 TRINITY_DN19864_c0_g1_i1:76-2265(+)
MGNCNEPEMESARPNAHNAQQPQRRNDEAHQPKYYADNQQPAAQQGPGGDPRGSYKKGDYVDAWWEGGWHPACIRTVRPKNQYDIDWSDGTMSYGVTPEFLRPADGKGNKRESVHIGNSEVYNAGSADQAAVELFRQLGGRPGQRIPIEQVYSKLRQPHIAEQFGWPTGRGDELANLLAVHENGRRVVDQEQCTHYTRVRWLFSLVDKDKNNRVSAWELETSLLKNSNVRTELGITPELAAPLFRQMDTDNDGWISLVEFYRFYVSNPLGKQYKQKDENLRRLYEKMGHGNRITLHELKRAMKSQEVQLELGWPAHHAEMLFQFLDQDRSGHITMDELKRFMRVQLVFNKIDKNRSGFIDPFEFGESLGDPGIANELGVSQRDAQHVFGAIDRDRSGTITFAEFFRYFSSKMDAQPQPHHGARPAARRLEGSDKYTTIKKLGEGTFGIVFLIKRKADGLDLIMKKPKLVPGSSMDDVKAEAQMLSRLKHPHIVRYTESYWEKGALIIITEFAGGGDIRSKIGPRGCGENAMKWFVESCDAVKYLHDRFILHRDLKPDNIFLTTGGSVKVGDLGLATQLKSPRDMAMTQCGTQIYMAPELMRGLPYDEKNDVWAMGCILFEMATGRFAFETVAAIVNAQPPRGCPAYCSELVHAMLEPDPRDRPSMDEVLDSLDYNPLQGMASYMSDRYLNRHKNGGGGPPVISPNDIYNDNYGHNQGRPQQGYYDHHRY